MVPATSGLCAVGGVAGVRAESGAAHRRGPTATATSMSSWVAPVRRSTRTTTPERPGLPLRRSARTFCREHGSHRPRVLERGIYDPTTGTFLTRDPANASTSTTQGNPYHYVGNDPLNRVDPEGLRASDPDFTPPPPPEPEVVDPDCATFNDHGESTDTSPSMGQFRVDCGVVKKILDRYLPVWRSHKVPIHTSYCNNDGSDMTIGLSGTASFCASWTALNVDWLKGDSIYHRMTGSLWDAYQFTVIHEYAHVVILSVGEIGLNPNGNNDPFRRYTGNDNAKGWPARDDLDAWADLLREEGGTLDDVGPRLIPYGRDMPLGKSEIVNELLADCIAQDAFSAVRGGYWLKYVPGNTEGCPRRGQLSGYRYVNGGTR